MKPHIPFYLAISAFLLSTTVWSSEKPDHFEGIKPENLEDAMTLFSRSNTRMAALLKAAELSPDDMNTLHEITYTLENAITEISTELDTLSQTLESVHQASENADAGTVQVQGRRYLKAAQTIVP